MHIRKKVFLPPIDSNYYDILEDIWKRCQVYVLEQSNAFLECLEKGVKSGQEYNTLKFSLNEVASKLEDYGDSFEKDPETVFQLANELGIDTDADLIRVYEIKEDEITEKIIKGLAYDAEAILCFLLKKLKVDPKFEFNGIEQVIMYAFDKFG